MGSHCDFNEDEFNEFAEEIFSVFRKKLNETYGENPKSVGDIIDSHHVIHIMWSSSEMLRWFQPYCSALAYSLLNVLTFPEVGFLTFAMCWKPLGRNLVDP